MTDLTEFLRQQIDSEQPWNCSTMASDWCVANGRPDFAAAWRGTIEPMACDAAAAHGGGLLALWERDIGDGLLVTDAPERGDIGVVQAVGMQTGAICAGERWAIRGHRTLHFIAGDQLQVLKAWHV